MPRGRGIKRKQPGTREEKREASWKRYLCSRRDRSNLDVAVATVDLLAPDCQSHDWLSVLHHSQTNRWDAISYCIGEYAMAIVAMYDDHSVPPIFSWPTYKAMWQYTRILKSSNYAGGGECMIGTWCGTHAFVKSGKQEQLKNELCAYMSLPPHDNLLRLIGVQKSDDGLDSLIFESHPDTCSLDRCFDRNLPPANICQWLSDLVAGVSHLHFSQVIHHDLHAGNILVVPSSTRRRLVVCDLGLAERCIGHVFNSETNQDGMRNALAPEQFLDAPITLAADIWNLGHLMSRVISKSAYSPHLGLLYKMVDRCTLKDHLLRLTARDLTDIFSL